MFQTVIRNYIQSAKVVYTHRCLSHLSVFF
uniref:Uncharacterized protein n=1 Tax=Siphoviridae sp. ctTBd21 TaxID=2825516 RepID=A0A8S5Q635_9CAUD|nr:MAG TPA: hypothetical protein [Siphoviridae sp. ctTBd21]